MLGSFKGNVRWYPGQGGVSLYKVQKMGSKSLTILQLFFNPKFYYQNFLLWPNAIKKSWSAHVELCVIQFSDCYVEPGQRYSMISETLPNWGGLKVENFGGKFKFLNKFTWSQVSYIKSAMLQIKVHLSQNCRGNISQNWIFNNSEVILKKKKNFQIIFWREIQIFESSCL